MRRICAIKVLTFLLGFTSVAAAETYPYVAYINSDQVRVRCDPSRDRLPTGSLDRGAKVEVYRESAGGWLAIRPPDDSFSWISSRHLTMTASDGIAEVTTDGAQVWLGTSIGNARLVSHIKLKEGELVEVLTSHRLKSISGASFETWYKISPPAGEFRWIHKKYVQRQKPFSKQSSAKQSDFITSINDHNEEETLKVGWTSRSEQESKSTQPTRSEKSKSGKKTRTPDPSIDTNHIRSTIAENKIVSSTKSITSKFTKNATALELDKNSPIQEQLKEVDLRLTIIASQDSNQRDFSSLRKLTEEIRNRANGRDIGRTVSMLEKIRKFEDLQNRLAELENPGSKTSNRFSQKKSKQKSSQFDGIGWLMPVIPRSSNLNSPPRGTPSYALTDDYGNVLQLVAPAPGLNIRQHARKQVGILGKQEYRPEYRTPYLTARRVISLDKSSRFQ